MNSSHIWRAYVVTFLSVSVACILVVAVTNYTVDAGGIFRKETSALKAFASLYVDELLQSEKGLVRPSNFTHRNIKLEYGKRRNTECYATGSSHMFLTNKNTVDALNEKCTDFTNLAVSGGAFEDFVTMASLIAQKSNAKFIFIEISPWFLTHSGDQRFIQYVDEYQKARAYFNLQNEDVNIDNKSLFSNTLNAKYFAYNLASFVKSPSATGPKSIFQSRLDYISKLDGVEYEFFTYDQSPDAGILLPDGSVQLDKNTVARVRQGNVVIKDGSSKMATPIYPAHQKLIYEFSTVVKALQQKGIKAALVLTPYHPKVWKCANPTVCEWLKLRESEAIGVAEELSVPLIGSYHPDVFNLVHKDFYDEGHVYYTALNKMWKILKIKSN